MLADKVEKIPDWLIKIETPRQQKKCCWGKKSLLALITDIGRRLVPPAVSFVGRFIPVPVIAEACTVISYGCYALIAKGDLKNTNNNYKFLKKSELGKQPDVTEKTSKGKNYYFTNVLKIVREKIKDGKHEILMNLIEKVYYVFVAVVALGMLGVIVAGFSNPLLPTVLLVLTTCRLTLTLGIYGAKFAISLYKRRSSVLESVKSTLPLLYNLTTNFFRNLYLQRKRNCLLRSIGKMTPDELKFEEKKFDCMVKEVKENEKRIKGIKAKFREAGMVDFQRLIGKRMDLKKFINSFDVGKLNKKETKTFIEIFKVNPERIKVNAHTTPDQRDACNAYARKKMEAFFSVNITSAICRLKQAKKLAAMAA